MEISFEKRKVLFFIIFFFWLALSIMAILYIDLIRNESREKLTYDKALSMEKEEILALLKEKEEKSSLPYSAYFIIAFAIVGFLLGIITLWSLNEEKKKERNRILKEDFLSLFPYEQRKIIALLIEKGGEEAQLRIRQSTGFSKVKLSRILRKMESLGLVEIEKGRVNFVKLGRNLKKISEELF